MSGGLRLATWNIHGAVGADRRCDPDRIASLIKEMRPDILALQEVDGRTHLGRRARAFETLGALLGGHRVEARLFGRPEREHGNLLWSRYPILRQEVHLLPGGLEQRGLIEAEIKTPQGGVTMFATHLGLSPLTRRRQARAIAATVEQRQGGVVVMGDLNEWRGGGWVDGALSQVLPVCHKPRSWPSARPRIPMDRVYASAGSHLTPLPIPAGAAQASDHLPVLVAFQPAEG